MHRLLVAVTAAALLPLSALAQGGTIDSAYTELDVDRDCVVLAASEDEGGDWSRLLCAGYRGFPVFIDYADARESLFYGFPPDQPDGGVVWESFDAFNAAGFRIEWRLEDGIPFATIHRWQVSDIDFPDEQIEVLVVEKVGHPDRRDGCAVGYVVATGNADANVKARRIADTQAREFACGADQPAVDAGSIPVPPFHRHP